MLIGAKNCDKRKYILDLEKNNSIVIKWDFIIDNSNLSKLKTNEPQLEKLFNIMDLVVIESGLPNEELVFVDKISKTLIVGDHVICLHHPQYDNEKTWKQRLQCKLFGEYGGRYGPLNYAKLGYDLLVFENSVRKVLKLDFQSIIVSHGELVEKNAKDHYRLMMNFVL